MNKLKKEKIYLQDRLFAKLGGQGNITDDEIKALIEEEVLIRSRQVYLAVEDRIQLKKELFNVFRRLDILSGFLEDDDVSEIMINGYRHIFLEKNGELIEAKESFSSEERLRNVIQQIVSNCNRIVNETNPIVDARLSDGSRVNVCLPPVALD